MTSVVLKTADDWDEWVAIIKSAAIGIGIEVWDLINHAAPQVRETGEAAT